MGPKALEMVMRDVLGGLEDFAIMNSYESDDILQVLPLDQSLDELPVNNAPSSKNTETGNRADEAGLAKVIPFSKKQE